MKGKRKVPVTSLDQIPKKFASEDAERAWWATHTLSRKLYDQLKENPTDLDAILPLRLPPGMRGRAVSSR